MRACIISRCATAGTVFVLPTAADRRNVAACVERTDNVHRARSAKVESGFAGQTSSFVPRSRSKLLKRAHDLFAKPPAPSGHLARRRAEPVIGPRFARTRWRFCPRACFGESCARSLLAIDCCHDIPFSEAAERFATHPASFGRDASVPLAEAGSRAMVRAALDLGTS